MACLVEATALTSFGTDVLVAVGLPKSDAELLSDSLVTAELWGHSSHGMLRLPWYVERLRAGVMMAVTESEIVVDTGAVVVIDGHDGIGQVLASEAVAVGVERAKIHGVSAVGVRNSNHFGTAGYFTRRAVQAGCLAFLATNASPAMAPWGGRLKAIGTNPWSIAAPAGQHGVAVLDIANTAVARGKIYAAAERGQSIPEGWAADETGRPTTDAAEAVHGLMLPMAGHKGYAISFMMDVLAGVLTGAMFGAGIGGPYERDKVSGCGHFLFTVDIAAIMPPADFGARMETLIAGVKNTPRAPGVDEIFFPGELEDIAVTRNSIRGIEVTDSTWGSLTRLAAETGATLPPTIEPEPEKLP